MGFVSHAIAPIAVAIAVIIIAIPQVSANETKEVSLRSIFDQGMSGVLGRVYDDSAGAAGSYCTPWKKCAKSLSCRFWNAEEDYGIGICTRVVSLGYRCGGPNDRCKKPGKCEQGYGGELCRLQLSVGAKCNDRMKTYCGYGLQCRKGYCIRDVGYGASCEGKYHYCRAGFKCDGQQGEKVCKVVVKKGGSCGYKNSVCYPGLVCSKWGTQSRCVQPYGKGGACGRPFAACKNGLTCYRKGGRKRCARIVGLHASCEEGHVFCKTGLTCVGYAGKRKCKYVSEKGGVCGIPYYFCKNNLLCLSFNQGRGKCVGIGKTNDRCDGKFGINMVCGPGMSCVGKKGAKKCSKIVQKGQKCGSYYGICEKGHFCQGVENRPIGICFKVLRLGYKCEGKHLMCGTGLLCTGLSGKKECRKPMAKGKRCDDPYWACARGFTCKGIQNRRYKWCV